MGILKVVPEFDEYVTKGAAMQAAAALTGSFPSWQVEVAELPAAPVDPRAQQSGNHQLTCPTEINWVDADLV